ncbi:hypothetical protein ACFZCP_20725 [Streptomyces sp. NPDC007971]|uniref:hypothetical protein n=1 Tax=Streptomyces sp. NPDC007971 TaxID=3364799 RepID=UPI0036F03662
MLRQGHALRRRDGRPVLTGDEEDFYEAGDRHSAAQPGPERDSVDMGEDFDFDDPKEMRRRLPRLAALYLTPGTA